MTMNRNWWSRLCLVLVVLLTCVHCTHGIYYDDINDLCDTCQNTNDTCYVFKDCLFCPAHTHCVSSVPSGVEDCCLSLAYRSTVLTGDDQTPSEVEARICNPEMRQSLFNGCPYGSLCMPDGQGSGVCCHNKVNANDAIAGLFQESFEYNGRTYLLSNIPAYNDTIIEAVCESMGGYLAEVEDADENDAIKAAMADVDFGSLIGFQVSGKGNHFNESFYFHFSNREMPFYNWTSSNPNRDVESCIILDSRRDFEWNDVPCSRTNYYFLCEIPSGNGVTEEGLKLDMEDNLMDGLMDADDDVKYAFMLDMEDD